MISLIDAVDLPDVSVLAKESDASLAKLQLKAEDCLDSWAKIGRPLVPCEMAYCNAVERVLTFSQATLAARYGCDD